MRMKIDCWCLLLLIAMLINAYAPGDIMMMVLMMQDARWFAPCWWRGCMSHQVVCPPSHSFPSLPPNNRSNAQYNIMKQVNIRQVVIPLPLLLLLLHYHFPLRSMSSSRGGAHHHLPLRSMSSSRGVKGPVLEFYKTISLIKMKSINWLI